MKTLITYISLVALISTASARTWTNTKGEELQADYLRMEDEKTVKLRMTRGGKVFNYPLDQLSDEDQSYITEKLKAEKEAEVAKLLEDREAEWLEDSEEAKEEAETLKLNKLILFTGSDWCPPCMAMESKTFKERDFQEYADEKLVLLRLDFPKGKKLKESLQKQNNELAKKYQLRGYPTMVITDSSGKELGRTSGYLDIKEFIQFLEKYE